MSQAIHMVVAVAENGVIGDQGRMPWQLSSDLQHFKHITLGHPIIMGRKTFISIGRALPGRRNIVLTRDRHFRAPDVDVYGDAPTALAACHDQAVMIIGGGEIYRLFEPMAQTIHLTRVHARPHGDTIFELAEPEQWTEQSVENHRAGPKDSADFSFVTLVRRPLGG